MMNNDDVFFLEGIKIVCDISDNVDKNFDYVNGDIIFNNVSVKVVGKYVNGIFGSVFMCCGMKNLLSFFFQLILIVGSVEYFYVNLLKVVDYVNVKGVCVSFGLRFCVKMGVVKIGMSSKLKLNLYEIYDGNDDLIYYSVELLMFLYLGY